MIDEKVLIERLKKYQIEYKSGFGSLTDETVFRVMENVIYIVKDLASEHNNGWICVEECICCKHKECKHNGKV